MSLSSSYKTDERKVLEGFKAEMPPNEDGSIPYFMLARSDARSNKKYELALERNMRPVRHLQKANQLKNSQADKLLIESFCEGALMSWGNVLLSDVTGNEKDKGFADFSIENAKKLFFRLPDLYVDLQQQSNDIANYRSEEIEAESKN